MRVSDLLCAMWWFLFLPGALGECLFAPDYTGHVTIPNSVTSIPNSAFRNCTSMTSVTIPNTVTEIPYQAFYRSGLTTVTIPNSVTEIEFNAFRETPLESVVISSGVTEIHLNTFKDCTNLDNVIIPVSVTSIEAQAFMGCTSLKTIKILNNATSIETTPGWESFYQAGCPQELYVAGADLCNCLDCFDCTADFCGLDDISYCTDLSEKLACGVTGTAPMTANLSNWQTGDVTSVRSLFASSAGGNYTFNDPSISTWDLSSCTDFSLAFDGSRFDHSLYWNVSSGVNFEGMFKFWYKNRPLYFTPTSSGTNFVEMFYYASSFNQPVGFLDTESGTNFTQMFSYASNFNQDVSHLKVRGSIKAMFKNALRFNQPLTWDVSGVENFESFLWMATHWSQDVSWWGVVSSNPCDARFTQNFNYAYRFIGLATTSYGNEATPQSYNAIKTLTCWQMKLNVVCPMISVSTFSSPQPTYNELCLGLGTDNAGCPHTLCHNNTDISGCSSLSYKLYCPMDFGRPASVAALDTSHITDLSYLFVDRFSVNPSFTNPGSGMAALPDSTQQAWGHVKVPIGNWNTSAVTSFEGTFWEAASFNQPLSWDTSAGTNFEAMFKGAHTFNQDLGHFSVQGSLASMFEDALAFDQPLQWNVSAVTNFSRIFYNASSFSHEDDIAAWDVSGGLDFTDAFSGTGELPACVVTEYRWRSDFNGYWCSTFDSSTATCGQLGRGNEGGNFYESDTYTGYQACPQCGQCELGVNLNATRVLRCWAFKSESLTVPNPIQSAEEYDVECTTATASPTTASPTTASPITASPTTALPTQSPTTAAPTSLAPTSAPTFSPTYAPGQCIGDASTWNSGFGPCSTYGPGEANDGHCSDHDQFDPSQSASQVCPQCGECWVNAPTVSPTMNAPTPTTPPPTSASPTTAPPATASPTTASPTPTTPAPTPTTPAPTLNELSGCPDNWSDLCTRDGYTTIGRCWVGNITDFACVNFTVYSAAFETCGGIDPRLSDCTDFSPAPTQASPAPDDGSSSSNTGMIVGIVVGAAFFVAVAVAVWWWRSRREFDESDIYM